MSMFLRFAPWVLFSVVTSQFDWRLGLVVGLVAQIVAIVVVRPRRIAMLDVAMVGFFTVGAVYASFPLVAGRCRSRVYDVGTASRSSRLERMPSLP